MRLRDGVELADTILFYAAWPCRDRRHVLFAAPKMKRVSEHYVAKQIVVRTVTDVERGIELKIGRDVTGEADRR